MDMHNTASFSSSKTNALQLHESCAHVETLITRYIQSKGISPLRLKVKGQNEGAAAALRLADKPSHDLTSRILKARMPYQLEHLCGGLVKACVK
jgi:hypothetical protein